ncbi:MAG: DUF2919 family protein [Gammaproteobacteria bacterium]
MSKVYGFSDYDKHLSLKFSAELWLVILYFLRPYILMVSGIRMGRGSSGVEGAWGLKEMVYPDDFSLFIGVAATIPVLFVLFAWIKRKPGASDLVRKIWRNGVKILLVSAVLNVLILFIPLLLGIHQKLTTGGWVQLGVSLVVVWFLFSNRRVKDTFADFPAEEVDSAGNSGK